MGQNMDPPEIEYGNDCLLKFEPGKTPKHIYSRFSKIQTCPGALWIAPNDRVFKLTQVEDHPCWWSLIIPESWVVTFRLTAEPPKSQLILSAPPNFLYFTGTEDYNTDEGHVFHSTQEVCAGWVHAIEGTGIITWRLEPLKLMKLLNIKSSKLFMEMRPIDDGSRVYKFCKLQDSTNIKIKYHPEA